MSWTDEKVAKLKELWGKGNTASQIAEIIGGISRNAVIGKAHRLNLSAKIKTRTAASNLNFDNSINSKNTKLKRGRKSRFSSLIIEKDFEPENPKQLEELDEKSCNWLTICSASIFMYRASSSAYICNDTSVSLLAIILMQSFKNARSILSD